MKYRELQAKLKELGINAKGSKAELEARLVKGFLDKDPEIAPVTPIKTPKTIDKAYRKFVFSGDPTYADDPDWDANDPAWTSMHGYLFELNGKAITVKPEIAEKLATHSHFTEQ